MRTRTVYRIPAMWKQTRIYEGTVTVIASTEEEARRIAEMGAAIRYDEKKTLDYPPLKVALLGEPLYQYQILENDDGLKEL